jgi:hypothetical protein
MEGKDYGVTVMECASNWRKFLSKCVNALSHFFRGLIREGNCKDVLRRYAFAYEVNNAMGDNTRFPRSCTSEHKKGAGCR